MAEESPAGAALELAIEAVRACAWVMLTCMKVANIQELHQECVLAHFDQ